MSQKKRVTGLSGGNFAAQGGTQWEYVESAREIVRHAIDSLEDYRVLYVDHYLENGHMCVSAAGRARAMLTELINHPEADNEVRRELKGLRTIFRDFQSRLEGHEDEWVGGSEGQFLESELQRLREKAGYDIAILLNKYGIEVDGELRKSLPRLYSD